MKKLVVIFVLLITIKVSAQDTTDVFVSTYKILLENLQNENWKMADSLTDILLAKVDKAESTNLYNEVLYYISIFSNAGLMNQQIITKEQALNKVKKYVGCRLILPAHLFSSNTSLNCTKIDDINQNTLFSSVSNLNGTQIFSFEYVKMKDSLDESKLKQLEGKYVKMRGILKAITVEGSMLPRFKMYFEDGEMKLMEE